MTVTGTIRTTRRARQVFAALPAPDPADLVGRWDNGYVGLPGTRTLGRLALRRTALRGWVGKAVVDTEHAYNRVLRDGVEREGLPMRVAVADSVVDGQPVVTLTYDRDAPAPFRGMRDEVRWLEPGVSLLGLSVISIRTRRLPPVPFMLVRAAG